MACFADINVSQGSVTKYAKRCGGIFLYPRNCKFTKESSSEKNCLDWLRFDRIMVMSLWPLVQSVGENGTLTFLAASLRLQLITQIKTPGLQ